MPVDVLALVSLIYKAGGVVIEQCSLVRQCPEEAARIAMRTQNVLAMLRNAADGFAGNVPLETHLLELRQLLEMTREVVARCKRPKRFSAKVRRMFRIRATRDALVNAEMQLERITQDLRLPMLTDIRCQLSDLRIHVLNIRRGDGEDNTEALIEATRDAIDQGMRARREDGASVGEVIQHELTRSARDEEAEYRRATQGGGYGFDDERSKRSSTRSSRNSAGNLIALVRRVRYEHLTEGKVLGQGTFGVVRAGTYMGREVAVKKARGPVDAAQTLEDFRREAEIHFAMRHANIVEVIAFSIGNEANPPCLVMELMDESLYDLLGVSLYPTLTFGAAMGVIQDICVGLQFLHRYNIVHRDIKSLNVLLDASGRAKLSDFGLAHVNSTVMRSTGGEFHRKVGSEFWMAPEVHGHRKATAPSDIFSLHVVMWEALTHQRAGNGYPIGIFMLYAPNTKLSLEDAGGPPVLLQRMQALMNRCGAIERPERPTMDEVVVEVSAVFEECKISEDLGIATHSLVGPSPRRHPSETNAAAAMALDAAELSSRREESANKRGTTTTVQPWSPSATMLHQTTTAKSIGDFGRDDERHSFLASPKRPLGLTALIPPFGGSQYANDPGSAFAVPTPSSSTSHARDSNPGSYRDPQWSSRTTQDDDTPVSEASADDSTIRPNYPPRREAQHQYPSMQRLHPVATSGTPLPWLREEGAWEERGTIDTKGVGRGEIYSAAEQGRLYGGRGATYVGEDWAEEAVHDRGKGRGTSGGREERQLEERLVTGYYHDDGDEGEAGEGGRNFGLSGEDAVRHFFDGKDAHSDRVDSLSATSAEPVTRPIDTKHETRHAPYTVEAQETVGFSPAGEGGVSDVGRRSIGSADTRALVVRDDTKQKADKSQKRASEPVDTAGSLPTVKEGVGVASRSSLRTSSRYDAASTSKGDIGNNTSSAMVISRPPSRDSKIVNANSRQEDKGKSRQGDQGTSLSHVQDQGRYTRKDQDVGQRQLQNDPPYQWTEPQEQRLPVQQQETADHRHNTGRNDLNYKDWKNTSAKSYELSTAPEDMDVDDDDFGEGEVVDDIPVLSRVRQIRQRALYDRAVMMTVYKECRGRVWLNARSWGTNAQLSKWFGIGVDGGRVTELILPRNYLSGTIPGEIGMLSSLQELGLHDNYLTGAIPRELGGLSSLLKLDLNDNRLVGEIPKEIGGLTALKKLFLGKNHLTGAIPKEIGNMRSLELLYLQENQIAGRIPREIGRLSVLQGLDLSGNKLRGSIPREIGDLWELQELTMGRNNLSGEIPPEISNLSRLLILKLDNNQLSGDIPPEVANLSSVVQWDLDGNDSLTDEVNIAQETGGDNFSSSSGNSFRRASSRR